MRSTRTFIIFSVVWVLLALATLWLVVDDGNTLRAALVAWVGGVLTYPLSVELWHRLRK